MPSHHLRIGTRGSPMALRQTALVRDRLVAARPELAATGAVEIVTIRTTGDRVQDRLLAEIGGKGLFVKEIEDTLIAGHIDSGGVFLKGSGNLDPGRTCDYLCDAARRPTRRASVDEGAETRGSERCEDRDGFVAPPGRIIAAAARSDDPSDPRQCEHADPQAGLR